MVRPAAVPQPSELMTLEIESIAAGGDGVARHNGMVVFVPRTAPGDRVLVRVTPVRRFARGIAESLLVGGPDRVSPDCPHYDGDQCGGCQLQHLTVAAQQSSRQSAIVDAMRRIGHRTIAVPELRSAPAPWR